MKRTSVALAGVVAVAAAGVAYLVLVGRGAAPTGPAAEPEHAEHPAPLEPARVEPAARPDPTLAVAPTAPPPVRPPVAASRPASAAAESSADKRARIDRTAREYLDALKIPPSVAEQARALRVSDEAVRAMYGAELLLHSGAQSPGDEELRRATEDSLASLSRLGDEGFLAVAANALGNPTNTSRVDLMAKATWKPGLEATLLDALRASPPTSSMEAPLRALGGIDSASVRAFLHGALETYRGHAANFAAAAAALGALHDGEKAGLVADRLRETLWSSVRPSLLDSLGRMGGDESKRVLVEYLRDPKGEMESLAIDALARIDPAAARAEAESLLAASTPNPLAGEEPARVRRFLGR